MTRVRACLACFACVLVLLSVTACGGGGSSAEPPETLVQGSYFHHAFALDPGPPQSTWSWWGDLIADGAGTYTGGTLSWNNAGGTSSASVTAFPYTVSGARRTIWSSGTAGEMQGGVSHDGRALVLGSAAVGSFPGVTVDLRRQGTGFGLTSLQGAYHIAAIFRAGATNTSWWGTANFSGTGTFSLFISQNAGGVISSPTMPAGTYGVSSDGTATLGLAGQTYRGGIIQGGGFAAFGGTTNPSSPTMLLLLIPKSTTPVSAATFTGPYHFVFMDLRFVGPTVSASLSGTANADGQGSVTLNAGAMGNEDGALVVAPATTIPYTVQPDGTLDFAGGNILGGVAPDGAFAVLGGRTVGGSNMLWVFVR